MTKGSLCGVWVDDAGQVHTTRAQPDGSRIAGVEALRPFAWLSDTPANANLTSIQIEGLAGEGPFGRLAHAEDLATFDRFVKEARAAAVSVDALRPLESEYLLQHRERAVSRSHVRAVAALPDGHRDRVVGRRFLRPGAAGRPCAGDRIEDGRTRPTVGLGGDDGCGGEKTSRGLQHGPR